MNWQEYLDAKDELGIDDDSPPSLLMSGVAGDNATRYLLNQKGNQAPNDENIFAATRGRKPDFVWNGSCIRFHGEFSNGGHPALAGFDNIYCAGRIMNGYFFFHSGHYHPKLPHALHFFSDFVNNTCAGQGGVARDQKVDALCKLRLKLYVDDSEDKTYSTTFERLATPEVEVTTSKMGTAPMMIGQPMSMASSRSAPVSIGQPSSGRTAHTTPIMSNRTASPEPSNSLVALEQETGINAYGRHQLQARVQGAPPWIADSARTKCALCGSVFGTFTRKHHCRRCGEIVCSGCSGKTKYVAHPAANPSSTTPEKQPVRVCDLCFNKQDLI